MRDAKSSPHDVLVYLHFDTDEFAEYLEEHRLFNRPEPSAADTQPSDQATSAEPNPHTKRKTLQLRFSDVPKGNQGLLIGRHSSCHITLDNPYMDKFHGTLTFNERHHLVFTDLGSRHGTSVGYGVHGPQEVESDPGRRRRGFTWVVGGPGAPKDVFICLGGKCSMTLTVPLRDWTSEGHHRQVKSFLAASRGRAGDMQLRNEMNAAKCELMRRDCPKPELLDTGPLSVPAYLGAGAFGPVAAEWNVSTGKVQVLKLIRNTLYQELSNWGKEPNIIECLGSNLDLFNLFLRPNDDLRESFRPIVYLEYAPLGSLQSLTRNLDFAQAVAATCQCLSAVKYMHARNVVHGNIKPASILLVALDPIHVKLTDFGAATVSDRCAGIRGSAPWFAPEMHAAIEANGNRKRRDKDGNEMQLLDDGENWTTVKAKGRKMTLNAKGNEIVLDANGQKIARGAKARTLTRILNRKKMESVRYGGAVDIWALGVVAMDLAWPNKLPGPDKHSPTSPRCKLIRNALAWDLSGAIALNPWLLFIKDKMLAYDPSTRQSAEDCSMEAIKAIQREKLWAANRNRPKKVAPKPPRIVVTVASGGGKSRDVVKSPAKMPVRPKTPTSMAFTLPCKLPVCPKSPSPVTFTLPCKVDSDDSDAMAVDSVGDVINLDTDGDVIMADSDSDSDVIMADAQPLMSY